MKGRFRVSFIVEAKFKEEVDPKDAAGVVEEAITNIIDHEVTNYNYIVHGGEMHGVEVKLTDFVNFEAEQE
jgi:hypothetical protein